MTPPPDFPADLYRIRESRKYRALDLPDATLEDLYQRAFAQTRNPKQALDLVREKLHHIVADYLGDPQYEEYKTVLTEAFSQGEEAVKTACRTLLDMHASTCERLPVLEGFYPRLWQVTGKPETLMDLACGLNPFAFPWMELPLTTRYLAYDLHGPRVGLINHYFQLQGLAPLAEQADILTHPPQIGVDVALFFKEAHRFEQRQRGCNRAFWQAIPARWLLVSLPTRSLSGKHDKLDQHRRLVYSAIEGLDWPVTEVDFGDEIVFCIRKS